MKSLLCSVSTHLLMGQRSDVFVAKGQYSCPPPCHRQVDFLVVVRNTAKLKHHCGVTKSVVAHNIHTVSISDSAMLLSPLKVAAFKNHMLIQLLGSTIHVS